MKTRLEFEKAKLAAMRYARKEAEGDLVFSGCAPLAGLPEETKKAICNALLLYSERGASRAITSLGVSGFIVKIK